MTLVLRTRAQSPRVTWVFLGLVLMGSMPAYAQDQAFKDGMKQIDDKKWAEAARLMRTAIEANAQDSNRKVEYGGVFGVARKNTEYLPQFYLGQALFMMQPQDCAGALNAWSTSEKHGAVQARRDLSTIMQGGYAECEKKGVLPPKTYDPLFVRSQQQYNEVNNIAREVFRLGEQNPEQWRPPEMREAYDRATAELETARTRLTSAARTRAEKDFTDASAAVDRARGVLVKLDLVLNGAIEAARSARNLSREVEQALAAAEADDRQIDTRMSASRGAGLNQSLGATRQQARDALSRGHMLYGTGSKSSNNAQLLEARGLARDASAKFKQVFEEMTKIDRGNLERQLSDARTSAAQSIRLLDDLFATLDRRMAANPGLAGEVAVEHEKARKERDSVRRRLDAASRGANLAAIQQATRATSDMRQRLGELTARFGSLTLKERGVSPALEDGSGRYLAGRYEEALQALNPAEGFAADDPLRLHIHLFRAASLHALYLKSRQTKPELRVQALAEIAECKKLDSAFQLDRRAFSPAFIALFEGGPTANDEAVASAR